MKIDVIYAAHLEAGDIFAGIVVPDAPTRPVQVFAHAFTLESVVIDKIEGRNWVKAAGAGFNLTPILAADQVLVIRP